MLAAELVRRLTGPNGEWLPDATIDPMEYPGFGWAAVGPFTNMAEKVRLDALDAYRKAQGDDANLNGVYFGVERIDY